MILPILAEMSGSIHVGLAALGAAIGVGLIGMGAASAVGRNPGAATPILVQAILAIALAEAIVFYALFLVRNNRRLPRTHELAHYEYRQLAASLRTSARETGETFGFESVDFSLAGR